MPSLYPVTPTATMPSKPTQRTIAELKKRAATYQVVERWCSFSRRRIDLYGCIDVLALDGGGILGIQATSGDNVSKRLEKAMAEPRLVTWLACGGRFEVWGFRKLKEKTKTGKTVERWRMRRVAVRLVGHELQASED